MKKAILFAAAGILLVSASPGTRNPSAKGEARGYPPCSRTVTDRCIQLYERGVRTPENLALNALPGTPYPARGSGASSAVLADTDVGEAPAAARAEAAPARPRIQVRAERPVRYAAATYPRCTAANRDRCQQQRAARISRAGERG
jgi:hypothetical protein